MASPRPAAFPPSQCPVRVAVDAALSSPDARGLLVVPSLQTTVLAIPAWQRAKPDLPVVAPAIAGTLEPTQLLAQLKSPALKPRLALVFSDQLVSAPHAPLLVRQDGRTQYLSGLEAVAHVGYGFPVAAWTGATFECAPAGCTTEEVLRLLLRYQVACHALGDAWLARKSQQERTPAARTSQARLQLRLFHSALMHMGRAAPLAAEYRPIVKRIDDLNRRLAAAVGA